MNTPIDYALIDTRIEEAGVMRCCLVTVAEEYEEGKRVKLGYRSQCRHCKEQFILVLVPKRSFPIWQPVSRDHTTSGFRVNI